MFLQEQIENLRRRIKNIEQNPRKEFLRCTKIRYEMEMEEYIDLAEAPWTGKMASISWGVPQLARAMGFLEQGYIGWGDRVKNPKRYFDIAVNKFGFPEHTCDRTMTALGLFLSGEVPMPKLFVSQRIPCDPERWSGMAAAKYAGVLFYELDRLNNCGDENIRCVGEQAAELIEYVERSVPGARYDEEKLVQVLEMDQQSINLLRDTYELRKRVPCPISPLDAFRLMTMPSRHANSAKALEYSRMYHDELFERAAKVIGGVHEEKLRIAWLATGPYGKSTFDLLARKGVSIPWFHYGHAAHYFGLVRDDYGDDSIYGRKLSPLEEMIRFWNANTWGGAADDWTRPLVAVCRDLKIDAVVDFLQVGCIPTKNLKRITAQGVMDELGIPTLDLEGREQYSGEAQTVAMNAKLEEFIDSCIANRNKK